MKTRKQGGFTLIELMIVVAIIAIIAAIAIPNLLSARLNANETSAISTLRNISSSQAQFQASSKADVDNDGTGEFGFFKELSGAHGIRTNADGSTVGSVLNPPVLSGAFRTINNIGVVSRSGYLFRMALPNNGGVQVDEAAVTAAFTAGVDADLCETTWACMSWPANYGNSGNRSFFVNQTGDITSTDVAAYSGGLPALWAGSGMTGGAAVNSMTGQLAIGTVGRDGNMWRQVN